MTHVHDAPVGDDMETGARLRAAPHRSDGVVPRRKTSFYGAAGRVPDSRDFGLASRFFGVGCFADADGAGGSPIGGEVAESTLGGAATAAEGTSGGVRGGDVAGTAETSGEAVGALTDVRCPKARTVSASATTPSPQAIAKAIGFGRWSRRRW